MQMHTLFKKKILPHLCTHTPEHYTSKTCFEVSRMLRPVRGVGDASSRGTESQSPPPPTMKKKESYHKIRRASPLPKTPNVKSSCIVIGTLPRTLPKTSIDFTRENRASGSRPRKKLRCMKHWASSKISLARFYHRGNP